MPTDYFISCLHELMLLFSQSAAVLNGLSLCARMTHHRPDTGDIFSVNCHGRINVIQILVTESSLGLEFNSG